MRMCVYVRNYGEFMHGFLLTKAKMVTDFREARLSQEGTLGDRMADASPQDKRHCNDM